MPTNTESKAKNVGPNSWVKHYADYLYQYAAVRIDDDELARDLVQETFLSALESWEKFDSRSSEKTWLTAILKNKIVDIYRKKSAAASRTSISAEDAGGFFDNNEGHWKVTHAPVHFGIEDPAVLENKEFYNILKSCLKKLPPLWNSVFTMKHIDEESSEDICAELALTPSNFWVISHRAKLNLRDCLQKNWA